MFLLYLMMTGTKIYVAVQLEKFIFCWLLLRSLPLLQVLICHMCDSANASTAVTFPATSFPLALGINILSSGGGGGVGRGELQMVRTKPTGSLPQDVYIKSLMCSCHSCLAALFLHEGLWISLVSTIFSQRHLRGSCL